MGDRGRVLEEVTTSRGQPQFILVPGTVGRALLLALMDLSPPSRDAPDNYHYVVSEPLGRNSYKEQYLFVYR